VILWFVGLSVALVWLVFQSPALDVRVVALGSLVPLHSLVAPVAALAAVMFATRRRRLLRRRLLGVPIGMFLHLVLDGAFTDGERFWWPLLGGSYDASLPELERSAAVVVAMELAGLAALAWTWRAFDLGDPVRRAELVRTGRLRPPPG
jgi:hypothetical protein